MITIKWIKLSKDLFNSSIIKQIESMQGGDSILVIWLKILCLASDDGSLFFTRDIPYTDELLANEFGKPVSHIKLALDVFQKFGMVELVDDIYKVSCWEQFLLPEDKVREQTRKRVAAFRARQKGVTNGNATVTGGNVTVTLRNVTFREIAQQNNDSWRGNCAESTNAAATSLTQDEKNVNKKEDVVENNANNEVVDTTVEEKESTKEKEDIYIYNINNNISSNKSTSKEEDKEKEIYKEKEKKKKAYGEFKNVLLTDKEYGELQKRFPNDYQKRIDDLSYYVASVKTKYKSHYLTILNWARREENAKPKYNLKGHNF